MPVPITPLSDEEFRSRFSPASDEPPTIPDGPSPIKKAVSSIMSIVSDTKNKGGRPRKEDKPPSEVYEFPKKPKIPKGKDLTPRKRTQKFFEDNIMDFAVVMWQVATDYAAKPSERYGAAKAAIEFGRGKAGQEEQIKNEKPQLQLHKIGGGSLKEELLGSHRVAGELPDSARNRLRDVEARLIDDVIPDDNGIDDNIDDDEGEMEREDE